MYPSHTTCSWLPLYQDPQPTHGWSNNKIAVWNPFCQSAPFPAQSSPVCKPVSPPDRSGVPQEYHDLDEVFSRELATSLLPPRPYGCAIDLLSGPPLPTSRLYNLSRPERETTENYIRESLNAGIIHPSSSPVGAGFFFVFKKDKTLRRASISGV